MYMFLSEHTNKVLIYWSC